MTTPALVVAGDADPSPHLTVAGPAWHLFGDRLADFERDMREILVRASPAGRFSVRLPDNVLRIWRLPALAPA